MYSSRPQSSVTVPSTLVEKRLGGRRLRGVQPAGDDDDAVRRQFNREHPLPHASRAVLARPRPRLAKA